MDDVRKMMDAGADKVVVKVFYDKKRVIDIEVTVEYGAKRNIWGTF